MFLKASFDSKFDHIARYGLHHSGEGEQHLLSPKTLPITYKSQHRINETSLKQFVHLHTLVQERLYQIGRKLIELGRSATAWRLHYLETMMPVKHIYLSLLQSKLKAEFLSILYIDNLRKLYAAFGYIGLKGFHKFVQYGRHIGVEACSQNGGACPLQAFRGYVSSPHHRGLLRTILQAAQRTPRSAPAYVSGQKDLTDCFREGRHANLSEWTVDDRTLEDQCSKASTTHITRTIVNNLFQPILK